MTLSKNIRYLRRKKDWSQDFVAEKLGYKSYTTIQKWEMGISEPPLKKLKELAELFSIDMDDLANKDLEAPSSILSVPKKHGVTINVLGRVAAGIPIDAVEDIIDTEEITEELAKTGEFFGLQIHGDSMIPNICDGDIVIATINGDEATCKRLRKYYGGIELISNNPSYKPFEFSNEEIQSKPVRIIGKVIELRRKF